MDREAPKTKKPIYRRWWFWLFGIIVLLIIIGAASSGNKNNSASNSSTSQAQRPAEQAIKVSASKLLSDYEANEVAADETYKGKSVQISGTIKNIGKDILDTPYVTLESDNPILSVQCMFDKSDNAKLAKLSQNQKIMLTGRVSGKLGNVLLKECSF